MHRSKTFASSPVMSSDLQVAVESANTDFDIYLNEALMPVLLQALDSLCRQKKRMDEQGDALDPKVRARFNPLTWLAQQLLRQHPRCATTPRRQVMYAKFKEWGDAERGRREILRRREYIKEEFMGFSLPKNGGKVQKELFKYVLSAIDDRFMLNGTIKDSPLVLLGMGVQVLMSETGQAKRRSLKEVFSDGEAWTFEEFWTTFSKIILQYDVVPYSAIKRGMDILKARDDERNAREEALRKEAVRKKLHDQEQTRLAELYTEVYEELMGDDQIHAILHDKKILTGDDVRPGDAGYEFEVLPKGVHCILLAKLMALYGVEHMDDVVESEEDPDNRWWTAELADGWSQLQSILEIELVDGVVEQECLAKVLVDPIEFRLTKRRVDEAMEIGGEQGAKKKHAISANTGPSHSQKPTFEELSSRLGITMARIHFLYDLFEGFFNQDEDPEAANHSYPENPGALSRDRMWDLMKEVKSDLTTPEFDARFQRIDEDGSGTIEFDEFVRWVREDEVRIVSTNDGKMSLNDLAAEHDESLALIQYLHRCFQDQAGVEDNYPEDPITLGKDDVMQLVSVLTPDVTPEAFENAYQDISGSNEDGLEFDDFLDVLDIAQIPESIREEAGVR